MSQLDYWNHNTAFHTELLASVASDATRVLDIGCGDGLLLQKLVRTSRHITGIDPDAAALMKARERLSDHPDVQTVLGDFLASPELDTRHFDLITCVATLHHMPLVPALERMRNLLAPGGLLRVVGLSANKTISDWAFAATMLVPVQMMSKIHHESGYPDMTTVQPSESLTEIREAAAAVLPGSQVRRRFYYRYTLTWTKRRGS